MGERGVYRFRHTVEAERALVDTWIPAEESISGKRELVTAGNWIRACPQPYGPAKLAPVSHMAFDYLWERVPGSEVDRRKPSVTQDPPRRTRSPRKSGGKS